MISMKLTMTTLQGLENILADEIRDLGGENIVVGNRAVECTGDQRFMYKANLCLRTALRILKPIHEFTATHELEYYEKVREIDWKEIFSVNDNFAVHAVVNSDKFTHSRYMALKAKDAIVDQFRDIYGRRPNVSTDDADMIINVHINQFDCTLSLDSSGEPLHKRGYKVAMHEAPLNEVLAAGLLIQTGFQDYPTFHDPMCGSGTLISEALMIHTNVPPAFFRENFAFMKWRDHDVTMWRQIKAESEKNFTEPTIEFSGADIDRQTMFNAKKNLFQLPFGDRVHFYKSDFLKDDSTPVPSFLIMNPPYDVRLETDDINQLYADIGTRIKHYYTGSRVCVFSGNLEAMKNIGLRPQRKVDILNGQIPSKLHCFDVFEGSLKEKV